MKNSRLSLQNGFTLVELLIVIGLLGILITAGLTSYIATQRNARDGQRRIHLENLRQALEFYKSDNSTIGYPNVSAGDIEGPLKTTILVPTYVSATSYPKDPRNALGYFYYYQRTAAYTYVLCAFLENPKSDDPVCPIAGVSCGTDPCNYGVTQQ